MQSTKQKEFDAPPTMPKRLRMIPELLATGLVKLGRVSWQALAFLVRGVKAAGKGTKVTLLWWGKLFAEDPTKALVALVFFGIVVTTGWTALLRFVRPKTVLIISTFEVTSVGEPSALLSGRVASDLVADEVRSLATESTSYMADLAKEAVEKPSTLMVDSASESVRVGVEIGGFSMERIASEWGKLRYSQRTVTGDVYSLPTGIKLRARMDDDEPWELGPFAPTVQDLSESVRQLGIKVLADFSPLNGGAYYLKQGKFDAAIRAYDEGMRRGHLTRSEKSRAYFYLGVANHLNENIWPDPVLCTSAYESRLVL